MALGIGHVISRYTVEEEEELRRKYEQELADVRKTLKEREKVAADARALWEADQKRRASYDYGRPTVHPPVGCRGLAGCMRAAWYRAQEQGLPAGTMRSHTIADLRQDQDSLAYWCSVNCCC